MWPGQAAFLGASTIRSSRAFKHPNGAALRIAPLFGPALSDHVRAGPFSVAGATGRAFLGRRHTRWEDPRRSRPQGVEHPSVSLIGVVERRQIARHVKPFSEQTG